MILHVSTPPPLPACPKCGRRIAAWRKDHCVYCGTEFPPELKQGVPEPETLKWVDRPGIPPEAARQLEMMKVVPLDKSVRPRSIAAVVLLLSIPLFGIVFYLLYSLVKRFSPPTAILVLLAGIFLLGYLGWTAFRARRS